MNKAKLYIINGLLLLNAGCIFAQDKWDIGASHQQGLNINKASDRNFGITQPIGVEFRMQKQKVGLNYWEKQWNYPQTGWSLSWINHRNAFLKHTVALNRYINYVFVRRKSFDLYLKLAQGAMMATSIYKRGSDGDENYNNAIGQYLNFSQEIGAGITIYPYKKIAVNLGLTAIHYSNGAMAQPNDGLNLVMFSAGVFLAQNSRAESDFLNPERPGTDKRIKININPGIGFKQLNRNDLDKYQLFTFSLYADKMISGLNALNIGADVYINGAEKQYASQFGAFEGKDYRRIGISLGHELFIGKVGLLTQIGYYLYSPVPSNSDFYQKFGFKYYFNEAFFTTFTAKIYDLQLSEEVAWGIGMRIGR